MSQESVLPPSTDLVSEPPVVAACGCRCCEPAAATTRRSTTFCSRFFKPRREPSSTPRWKTRSTSPSIACCCGRSGASSRTCTSRIGRCSFGSATIPAAAFGWAGRCARTPRPGPGHPSAPRGRGPDGDRRRRWWACCGPRFPTSSAAPAGPVRPGRVTVGPMRGLFGPALGSRPDSPPPPASAHPALAPVGASGAGENLQPECAAAGETADAALQQSGRALPAEGSGDMSPAARRCSTAYGPLERTDAYWQWLLKRHAYDQLYVALEGPEQLELGEISTRIVGYAATRGEQIVELMAAPGSPAGGGRTAGPLLWRRHRARPALRVAPCSAGVLRCSRFSTRPAAVGRRGRRITARCT